MDCAADASICTTYCVLPLPLMPLIALWRWGKHARKRAVARQKGHCAQCGYDLRATRDRCPECGAAVEGVPAAVA